MFFKKLFENKSGKSVITINGTTIVGDNVVISNGKIIVNGKDYTPDDKNITVSITGDLDILDVASCSSIKIIGNVNEVKTVSGDVEISGSVGGNVKTTSGDVKCGDIGGSVTTVSGDIKNKK